MLTPSPRQPRPLRLMSDMPRYDRKNTLFFNNMSGVTISGVQCQVWVKERPVRHGRGSAFNVEVFMCPTQDVREEGQPNVSMTIPEWCADYVLENMGIDLGLNLDEVCKALADKDFKRVDEILTSVDKSDTIK